MLDLLTGDGSSAEDLLPPASSMDGMDMLHSYSFTQQLLMPQGLELGQHALHSPDQASMGGGLDDRGPNDAVANFFSMQLDKNQPQPVGGLVHSRSMTRLVPTPAQATANMQLLAAASAANALPTSSRALQPPGLNSSSLPGSPRALTSASPRQQAPSSSTNIGEQMEASAEDITEVSPEPRLPPPGAASKATSTASDLVPSHYQGPSSGGAASSKLLTLLTAGAQANREAAAGSAATASAGMPAAVAAAEAGGRRRSGSASAAVAAGGGNGSQAKDSGASGAGRAASQSLTGRGAIFPSGEQETLKMLVRHVGRIIV